MEEERRWMEERILTRIGREVNDYDMARRRMDEVVKWRGEEELRIRTKGWFKDKERRKEARKMYAKWRKKRMKKYGKEGRRRESIKMKRRRIAMKRLVVFLYVVLYINPKGGLLRFPGLYTPPDYWCIKVQSSQFKVLQKKKRSLFVSVAELKIIEVV